MRCTSSFSAAAAWSAASSRNAWRRTAASAAAPSTSSLCTTSSRRRPPAGAAFPVETLTSDFAQAGAAERLIAPRPDLIFHLAAIVSGEAEADFEKGDRINLDGTRFLFDAIRKAEGYTPRVVFTSSIAVFGAPFPEAIGDDFFTTPLTSYGAQKAIGELLLADYTRRGFFDGVGIRLPTICVRPGKPNKAASGFFSGIIREPLAGQEAVLPVADDVRHAHASPRSAVNFLVHAAAIDGERLGARRIITMPSVSVTVGRADRFAPPHRRRQGRRPHPPRARPDHRTHRLRLAAPLRRAAGEGAGLCERNEFRRDRPHPHRGRTWGDVREVEGEALPRLSPLAGRGPPQAASLRSRRG